MPPKTSKATAQPSVSSKLIDETKIPFYRDDIDTYFRDSIYPNVENYIKIKNNITLVSWDLIYEFFLKIYQNINIIEKNAMFEYYSRMKPELRERYVKYLEEEDKLNSERKDLITIQNNKLLELLIKRVMNESQYQRQLHLYSTKLDKEFLPKYTIKLFDYYRSVEQELGILNLYNINEDSATDIIIFIHNVIIDTSMGKNNWKNVKLQELSEIIDIEYSEFKDTNLIDVETLLLNNNKKLNVFANLKKYFYYCMYLFQTKLQNSVISPYYQIKFFELFKKIKQKITLNIIKIFDNRIFKVYNDKFNYDISDRQNFMTKIKERFESFIYFNKVRDIDTLKSIIEELNDGILKRDEDTDERIQKVFAQFSYIFKDIFKLDDKTIDIYTSLIKLYNVLIYVLETNSQFSSNKLYNRFLKIVNDFDGLEINISFQELKRNVETHFNKPGTSLQHSKESSKSSNRSVYTISQQIAHSNNETIKAHREKVIKFYKHFQYCDFINANDFSKSQIIGIAMYTDKISYLEGLERLPFEDDDIYDEQWYNDMEKELFIEKTRQELYSSLDLGNNLIVTIPKYIKLSDELYRKFGVETKLEEGGINFDDDNELHISLYDFLLFHFKKYIVSFTAYMIKFMFELIDYYNGLIKNRDNRIIIKTRLLSKITPENKVDKLFYNIFNNDLILISKNLIYGTKHNEMKMLQKSDPRYKVMLNTIIDSKAYNDVIYLLLNEEYIQKKLTKYYDGNYNFSKLINEFNKLKYDYFDVIFLALNDRYTNIYELGVINFTNYVRSYLQYLIKNQENIRKTFDTKEVNKTKKKVIRIKVKDTDLEKERKNLVYHHISNSLNQTFNNQNSKQIDVNNIKIIKDRTYNIILYLMLKNKYFAFDINLIDTELLTNIILCLQLNLHNEFILNIVFPQLFKLFYNLSMEENSKMNKKFKIMIDTYNFALFDRIFLLNIPLIEYQKIFVEELLTKVRDIKKSYYISDFLYKKTDISLDDTFINIILYIYYSKYIFTPYTKTNYWKKNSLILLNNYNTFYDYYFKHFEKTPKSNFQLELVNLPKKEFDLRLLKKIEEPKETPKKPKGVDETITPVVPVTPVVPIEELNYGSMVAGPSSAIQSNIQPINVGRVVIDERRIIDTTTDELYMNLLDELYDLNKNSKEILKSWKLIDKKIYNYKENPHRYKIDNKKLLDRDKRIFKSMLIYKNRFLSRRVYEKFDSLYTFLQINDVHYTSIKYSISEKDITKTCGAYTHLTLKICDDNTPKSFYKYLLSNYENEFSERPDLMRKVEYIYLHYGLSDVRSEHYGLEPGLWINIEFENPEIKFRSKNILTKNINKEYKNIIEFIHNLYMYFIEFVKFNNYTYYIKPNCTTKEIRFITNKELLV